MHFLKTFLSLALFIAATALGRCAEPAGAGDVDVPMYPGTWDFCGLPVDSPLGIPAGPLLNSRWILYYAGLGFSVLTYKTVRSAFRASYERPNLIPVAAYPVAILGKKLRQIGLIFFKHHGQIMTNDNFRADFSRFSHKVTKIGNHFGRATG